MHGELTTLGIKIAPSTVWEILKQEGLDPAPERASTTWADFLRSQADALLACDLIETATLNGQRQYILALIEHATRRVRVLGTTAHPTASWVTQAMKQMDENMFDMSLESGEFCFIDNYRVVHGRKPFRARHDGTDRWLKRSTLPATCGSPVRSGGPGRSGPSSQSQQKS
ncbi:TauD/TfdA family dioxygenase [Planotetraspora sp. A-T 1434]|uniref:TauD/TfdA family dioxygenase n=1 Tax=Planotetraspora sp. A-T 1434 TaxID=2979219 RepID=UPI0021BE6F48|nr:TauD/TfdA family dioxygenase [Planotetraspora sp. A-T 1434]MCT9929921.1 TauD/TfdA family dioxygenase [Planotetraspora sp. A-T 1434]